MTQTQLIDNKQVKSHVVKLVFLMKKTNVITKNRELASVFNSPFQGKVNLARVKLISYFIIALCKEQTVTFEKVANAFDTTVNPKSSLRGLQL